MSKAVYLSNRGCPEIMPTVVAKLNRVQAILIFICIVLIISSTYGREYHKNYITFFSYPSVPS
jgi:hypothetical protein